MRAKREILDEIGKNRQWGAFGGISPDTEKIIRVEILIDIRDALVEGLDNINCSIKAHGINP